MMTTEGTVALLREWLECTEHLLIPLAPDPAVEIPVRTAGNVIGPCYGAVMSEASRQWREYLIGVGLPPGGEHVAGPCRATIERLVVKTRAVLDALDEREAAPPPASGEPPDEEALIEVAAEALRRADWSNGGATDNAYVAVRAVLARLRNAAPATTALHPLAAAVLDAVEQTEPVGDGYWRAVAPNVRKWRDAGFPRIPTSEPKAPPREED